MPEFRILFIDDDPEYTKDFEEFCETQSMGDREIRATTTGSFVEGERLLADGPFDALVVDLHEQGGDAHRGEHVLDRVKAMRFMPVVFYTGHAERLAQVELEQSFVGVVKKTDGFNAVFEKLGVLRSKPAHTLREAMRHVLDEIEASFFWGFVQRHADVLDAGGKEHMLAGLLADRLGAFLQAEGAERLLSGMGFSKPVLAPTKVHPITYYMIPPIGTRVRTCELLKKKNAGTFALILTPACDLALQADGTRRAESVLLVTAHPLAAGIPAYKKWSNSTSKDRDEALAKFMGNNSGPEQYHFLPGIDTLPDLVLDFQKTVAIQYCELDDYERLAALASPHAQEVRNRFVRWVGRVGTPVLDADYVIARLRTTQNSP